MIVAGYLDLPAAHKLALLKFADSADEQTRHAYPGLDAVRLWAGAKRAWGNQVVRELQERGLLMQISAGRAGQRAEFKIFPSPGDERHSLAARRGRRCPGVELFAGVPAIPDAAEVAARLVVLDEKDPGKRGGGRKASGSSHLDPETTAGSSQLDPRPEVQGPDSAPGGSSRLDKRVQSTGPLQSSSVTTTSEVPSSSANADAPADQTVDPTSDSAAKGGEPRADVEALCVLLADCIAANGVKRPTITKRWRDAARLLLDRDGPKGQGVPFENAEWLIHWATKDTFWRGNILSMPKFRQKYDQLYLKVKSEADERKRRSSVGRESTADRAARMDDQRREARQLDEIAAASGAPAAEVAKAALLAGLTRRTAVPTDDTARPPALRIVAARVIDQEPA